MTELKRQLQAFDLWATSRITALPPGLRPLFTALSEVGHPVSVAIMSAVLVLATVRGGQPHLIWVAGLAFLSLPVSAVLKRWFHRMRPETAQALGLHNYSFPSGHTYGSTLVYGLLAVLTVMGWPGLGGAVLGVILSCMVVGIGISRVYLGAHYPTDVAGGWLLGLVGLALIIAVTQS